MALCPAKRPKPRALCAVLLCAESVAVGAGATITLPLTQNRSPTAGKTDDRSSLYLCSLRIPLSCEVGRSFRFWPQLSGTRTKAHTRFLELPVAWGRTQPRPRPPWPRGKAAFGLGEQVPTYQIAPSMGLVVLGVERREGHRGPLGPRWVCGRRLARCCLIFQEMQFEGTFSFSPNFTAVEACLKSNGQIQAVGTASPQTQA